MATIKSYEFAQGENFKPENPFDAVLGAVAALKTSLQIGEKFQAVHGTGEGGRVHKETFNVVGILAPTGTPIDRAIFVNMQGFYDIHHHEDEEARSRNTANMKNTRPKRARQQRSHRRAGVHPQGPRRSRADRRGGQANQRRQGGPGRRARQGDYRTVRGRSSARSSGFCWEWPW